MLKERRPTRREFLLASATAPVFAQRRLQRTVVLMIDGLGMDYWQMGPMPVLHGWARSGIFKPVGDVMPSVTNANNTSICCGCYPAEHGITGNSYLDSRTGTEEYMESAGLVLAPTLFERAKKQGVRSALLSSKRKTTTLLNRGADIVMTAEAPQREWTEKLGPAPDIYSPEINLWLLKAAIHILKTRREIGCLYVHTTDYPMHMWAPAAPESKDHLSRLDALIGEAAAAAPDAAFLLTADHGLNSKTGCWDLERACLARGVPIRMAISAERDKYVKHHRGFGGTSWVYLKAPGDERRVRDELSKLPGVELVLSRSEAAAKFRLMPSRIGDLVVTGDRDTVFGGLNLEFERLARDYRSHGSQYETQVPLLLHNAEAAPKPSYFEANAALARWLYRS
jgi:phosphonoacetate hydrolase